MRPIKFRAWCKKEKSWVYLYLKNAPNQSGVQFHYENLKAGDGDWEEWMQFTGLKDKNGKEIYEGDILRVDNHYEGDHSVPEALGVVKFQDGEFCILNDKNTHFLTQYFGLWESTVNYGCEVIGNIYENPNLLASK